MGIMNPIKGFMGILVGTTLGSAAITQIGNMGSGMSSGMRSATQSLVSVGVVGHTAGTVKKMFRW